MLFMSRTSPSAARGLAALFCTTMLSLVVPVSASADLYLTAPNALRSVDGSSGANGGGIVPMAVPAGGTFECNATWVTVAAKPSGYAIGNWLSGQVAQNFIRAVPAGAQHQGIPRLAWRYVTKYVIGSPWNQWFVMVRDRAFSPGQGNWLFTHHSCFQ